MKIYIAGKINGEPIMACIKKFIQGGSRIASRNMQTRHNSDGSKTGVMPETIIPLELKGIHFGIEHEKAMEICLEALKDCTHAYFLEDWKDSKGAKIEHQYCLDNNIKIIYEIKKWQN